MRVKGRGWCSGRAVSQSTPSLHQIVHVSMIIKPTQHCSRDISTTMELADCSVHLSTLEPEGEPFFCVEHLHLRQHLLGFCSRMWLHDFASHVDMIYWRIMSDFSMHLQFVLSFFSVFV